MNRSYAIDVVRVTGETSFRALVRRDLQQIGLTAPCASKVQAFRAGQAWLLGFLVSGGMDHGEASDLVDAIKPKPRDRGGAP